MRSELLDLGKYTILNDCYKSNPSSLWEAIKLFYSFQGYQRKIAVLGDMNGLGESGPMFHKRAGGWLHPDKVDYVLTFGGTEPPHGAIREFSRGPHPIVH
ncbi:MAG: glutamate ligase domain-containing protein [Clostridia bacterium]